VLLDRAPGRSEDRSRAPSEATGALLGLAAILLAAAAIAVPAALLLSGEPPPKVEPGEVAAAARDTSGAGELDPFAFRAERRTEFELRAATGLAHILYANSPGGVVASAERTARFRDEIEAAVAGTPVSPELLEAMVFLESAGRPQVIAGDDPEAAAGLTQIVASTGTELLGMEIDLERSRELTTKIARATERDREEAVRRLIEERAAVDPRFDPEQSLEGAVRYLETARARFGREDLAVASYHMGIGNLESVVRAYAGAPDSEPAAGIVAGEGLSYAQLYFDSSPVSHAEAWDRLSAFADESAEYYWKVLAAREIMRLYREDRAELVRLAELHAAKSTAEEVFHPAEETEVFEDHEELADAHDDGELVALPDDASFGFTIHRKLGEYADELGASPDLYSGLRPEALATLVYLAERVRALNDGQGALVVTSAVRDQEYQDLLAASNPEATHEYSLHTTGWSFDILRRYEDRDQAAAFQFVLDRLRALSVIDYAYEPAAIHITVSEAAAPLVEE
jgi:hypothetical protein